MVLRGTFLARSEDLDWFLGSEGVARVYPEAWRVFLGATGERGGDVFSLIESLYRKIRSEDRGQSWQIAQAWEQWGGIVTLGNPTRAPVSFDEGKAAELVRKARIELHYAQSAYFIRENQILDEIERVLAIPTVIIHGGKDLVCSPRGAVMLHEAHPNSMLRILEDSGHVPNDEAMISALIEAVEAVAQNGFNL
jgi:proline iminopeptidase